MDSRTFLGEMLLRTKEQSPNTSLRSFAKTIGLSPSYLSDLLHGRKTLSLKKAQKVGQNLFLNESELRYWMALVSRDLFPGGDDGGRLAAIEPARDDTVSLGRFDVLAHWYILPILELTSTIDFGLDPQKIAKRLGITAMDATMALARLERFKLVKATKAGLKRTHRKIVFRSEESQANLQRFHAAMLKKTIESLTTQTNAEKYVGTETMAFDPDDLPKVKALIDECFDKVSAIAGRGRQRSEVYHMGIQFFRITN